MERQEAIDLLARSRKGIVSGVTMQSVAPWPDAVPAETVKQNAIDTVVTGFDDKIKGVETKLYSGTVTLARELQDLQADVAMIKRQRTEQEDAGRNEQRPHA